ncbi:MAG TPA: TolC family protein [Opitutaceae bacterium]
MKGRIRCAAATAVLAVLVAGCVNQDHEVAQYRQVLDEQRPKPARLEAGETLTLDRALALANADNEQLASQGETYLQALIAKDRAFSAFLPTLNFTPNLTVEQAPRGTVPATAPGAPPTSAAVAAATSGNFKQSGNVLYRIQAPVVGNMTFAYRDLPLFEAAKMIVAQRRELLLDAQQTLMLDVAQTYFQAVTLTEQTKVLANSLELQRARVRDLQARVTMRLSLPLDLAQQEANEAATEVSLRQAENALRDARRMLAFLIGAPAVDGALVEQVANPEGLAAADDCVRRALAERPDYQAALAGVQAARAGVRAAVAEYYPSVSLSAAGFLYEEHYADASKWNGILSASLPIFSAGQIHEDVRNAWSQLRSAGLMESYLRRNVSQQVLDAYDDLQTSGVVLGDLRREVDAATKAYAQAAQLEKNGLAIPLDVLTAEDTLLNAELQYASQAFNRTVAYLNLLRVQGELKPDAASRLRWVPIPL